VEAEVRRVYVPKGPVKHITKKPIYKPNPIKQPHIKGTILDIWESRTHKGFEMLIEWKDMSSSIELTDVRLRVGSVITL
jgi:hypothetical protein